MFGHHALRILLAALHSRPDDAVSSLHNLFTTLGVLNPQESLQVTFSLKFMSTDELKFGMAVFKSALPENKREGREYRQMATLISYESIHEIAVVPEVWRPSAIFSIPSTDFFSIFQLYFRCVIVGYPACGRSPT